MNLNRLWMNLIKESNRDITFIGFITQNNQEFVKVNVKNEFGGKDTVTFKVLDGSKNMRSNEWEHIQTVIKTRSYESRGNV